MQSLSRSVAVLLFMSTLVVPTFGAATTAPATATAPKTPVRPMPVQSDYSTPKKSVASFLRAVQSTDRAAVQNVLTVDADQKRAVDAYVDLILATNALEQAATNHFGEQADQYFGVSSKQLESRLKAIEDAPLKIVGESALIQIPADAAAKQPGGTIVLKKVGKEWKIDASTLFKLNDLPKAQTERNVAMAEKMVDVTKQMTQEIGQGKFASAAEAYQEFWNRSLDVAKQLSGGTKPGAKPATVPAK